MSEFRKSTHSVRRLTVHLVWVTKYWYQLLKGDTKKRCRGLIHQICDSEDVKILNQVISKDQVHMQNVYLLSLSFGQVYFSIE